MSKHWLVILWGFTKGCRPTVWLSVLCAVTSVLSGFVPYYAIYRLIGMFINTEPQMVSFNQMLFWCGIMAAGYLTNIILHAISSSLSHIAAFATLEKLRLAAAEKLYRVSLGDVQKRQAGTYKDILLDRIEEIEKPLAHLIPEFSSNLLLPVLAFFWMCSIHPLIGISLLAAPLLAMIPMHFLMKDYNSRYAKYMKKNKDVNSVIVEYVNGIEVIKTFNQGAASYEKFAKTIHDFRAYTLEWFKSTWKEMHLAFAIMPTTLLGVLPVGLFLFCVGKAGPDELAIAFILSLSIITPLQKLSVFIDTSKPMEYAVKEVNEILELSELPEGNRNMPEGRELELHNVSFSYDKTKGKQALHNISLTIPEGSFTALAGPSGGGKSTIARLIARMWDPSEGEILIGGISVQELSYQAYSQAISYVTQDNFLFNCSLKENIRMGKPDADDEEVLQAAKAARCDVFIERLPKGYDTPAGEAGKLLSGGEKQRIAIARAILKDAPIIILDEATAFTDPENEYYIQQSMSALAGGTRTDSSKKTLIVIAHRLSTIQHADQIILVDKGCIVAKGTQEELLAENTMYQNMWAVHTGAKGWSVGSAGARNHTGKLGTIQKGADKHVFND